MSDNALTVICSIVLVGCLTLIGLMSAVLYQEEHRPTQVQEQVVEV